MAKPFTKQCESCQRKIASTASMCSDCARASAPAKPRTKKDTMSVRVLTDRGVKYIVRAITHNASYKEPRKSILVLRNKGDNHHLELELLLDPATAKKLAALFTDYAKWAKGNDWAPAESGEGEEHA